MERRLRDIVVRALRNSALVDFMVGLEKLLEGFAEVRRGYGTAGMAFQVLMLPHSQENASTEMDALIDGKSLGAVKRRDNPYELIQETAIFFLQQTNKTSLLSKHTLDLFQQTSKQTCFISFIFF